MSKGKKTPASNVIALNKKARFDYFVEQEFEAGLVLEGWEVKSIREGRAQLKEGYVILKGGEAWLLGALISPLPSASTHIEPDQQRTRKLLLHDNEIKKLIGHVERQGYTIVPLKLYWKRGRVKCLIGIAKGKKQYDKRQVTKDREWNRQKARVLKRHS